MTGTLSVCGVGVGSFRNAVSTARGENGSVGVVDISCGSSAGTLPWRKVVNGCDDAGDLLKPPFWKGFIFSCNTGSSCDAIGGDLRRPVLLNGLITPSISTAGPRVMGACLDDDCDFLLAFADMLPRTERALRGV